MTIPIKELRGISADLADKLKQEGLSDSDQFLEAAATPAGRKKLAGVCGVGERVILELANRADLARIKGVAGVFADLLEHAGVDTVKELATRRPDNLHAKIKEVNEKEKLSGRLPALSEVERWVAEAKEIGGKLSY